MHPFCSDEGNRNAGHVVAGLPDTSPDGFFKIKIVRHVLRIIHPSAGLRDALGKPGAGQILSRNFSSMLHHGVAYEIAAVFFSKHYNIVCIKMKAIRGREVIEVKHRGEHPHRLAFPEHPVQLQHRRPGSGELLTFYFNSNPLGKPLKNMARPDAVRCHRYSIQPDKRQIGKEQTRTDSKNHGLVKFQTMKAQ